MRGYVLCTAPRTGSNWIGELCASTGALGYPLEYFNTEARRVLTDPEYPDDRSAQVRWILTRGASPNGVYGLKIFPWQHDLIAPRMRWTEALPDLRFVHLRRRDLLGQALSAVRAEQTGSWRSTSAGTGEPRYDGAAVMASLRMLVNEQARWELFFARNGIEPLRLVYEAAVREPQCCVDRVAELMELPHRPAIAWNRVGLAPQRDALTEEWRQRFRAEFGDLDTIDTLVAEHR
jgi:LPS sulfotransferase NodH